MTEHVRVAVIGSGFGGLGAAVRLRREGITDFVVLERADGVGGTWRDNSYPGCACDVPSHLYSFSFAPNPDWPRAFSGQEHIRAYLEHVTDTFGLRPHLRFGSEVRRMTWDRGNCGGTSRRAAGGTPPTSSCPRPGRCPIRGSRTSPDSTRSPARSSTRPAGTTTTTSPACGSPWSARAPPPPRSCPRSSRTSPG